MRNSGPDRAPQTGRPTSQKVEPPGDSLKAWMDYYQRLAVQGVRSTAVADKIALHLLRFREFFEKNYGHDRISTCLHRDVLAWQSHLDKGMEFAPATINSHIASLSAFATWVHAHNAGVFPLGDPTKGIPEIALPPLEPRALSEEQVRSLKNVCDRLPLFHRLRGRCHRHNAVLPTRASGRPWRDRALIFVLLSTGLRREELVNLDLEQIEPGAPEELRRARKARIVAVKGKNKTERSVFVSQDARLALADYLEKERPRDAEETVEEARALFLSAACQAARRGDGRLSVRAVNLILEQIGRWHDSEVKEAHRKLSPLRPHDLRHTFAFQLSRATGADAYELERRLGHRSQRYIQRYTNPPEEVAASYVETF